MVSRQEHYLSRVAIKAAIKSCNLCALGANPNRVPFDGNSWSPRLIIIGEAPGAQEALAKRPFVGQAGQLLDDCLLDVGLNRSQVAVLNTVCCRPPDNRDPAWGEMVACQYHREDQINLIRTSIGLVLGRVALSGLMNDPGVVISKHLNHGFWSSGVFWIPTYHPAYALRNHGAKSVIVSSIKMALRFESGEVELPVDKTWPDYSFSDGVVVKRDDMAKVPARVLETYPVFTHSEWALIRHSEEYLTAARELRKAGLA